MIKRKADELIRDFILHEKSASLVTGARQVGKTFLVRKVCKECFENVIEINFVEQPDAIELFRNISTPTTYAGCIRNSAVLYAPAKGTSPNMTMGAQVADRGKIRKRLRKA